MGGISRAKKKKKKSQLLLLPRLFFYRLQKHMPFSKDSPRDLGISVVLKLDSLRTRTAESELHSLRPEFK